MLDLTDVLEVPSFNDLSVDVDTFCDSQEFPEIIIPGYYDYH